MIRDAWEHKLPSVVRVPECVCWRGADVLLLRVVRGVAIAARSAGWGRGAGLAARHNSDIVRARRAVCVGENRVVVGENAAGPKSRSVRDTRETNAAGIGTLATVSQGDAEGDPTGPKRDEATGVQVVAESLLLLLAVEKGGGELVAERCEGHAQTFSGKKIRCARPGCYATVRCSARSPLQRFCCSFCRKALRQAHLREERWRGVCVRCPWQELDLCLGRGRSP